MSVALVCRPHSRCPPVRTRGVLSSAAPLAVTVLAALSVPGCTGALLQITNPVVPGDHPDPSVIRVGSEYWATSTSAEWAPHFPLFKSSDLLHWEQVGHIFQTPPAWVEDGVTSDAHFWAPELVV